MIRKKITNKLKVSDIRAAVTHLKSMKQIEDVRMPLIFPNAAGVTREELGIVPRRTVSPSEDVDVMISKEVHPGNKVLHRVNNGEIIVKVNEKPCRGCTHEKHLHYGSLNHQCNTRDCECDEYK